MDIKLIKRAGVPEAEIAAHQAIQKDFDNAAFSKGWRGYASFALARSGRGSGDDDFDLVLVTHTNILVIELKNWNGKHLTSDGRRWFVDGTDRGDSPVAVVNRKVPKLVSVMQQKLGRDKTPFIKSYVVLHGRLAKMDLPPEEERSVLNMTQFLSLRFQDCYRQIVEPRPRVPNPLLSLAAYDEFFEGPSFKQKIYYVDGFRPTETPLFEHPKKLYREFHAYAKDDPETQALLRSWNFLSLGLDLIGERDRPHIGLREQRIYEHVVERNEELSLSLLRPISNKTEADVTVDFIELYRLPPRLTRLDKFVNSVLPKVSPEERLGLVQALVSRVAALHDLNIAHRDLGPHSIWFDRPVKIVMSGFPAAYFPDSKTLGSFRDKIKVEQLLVPEDGTSATPFHRDVFMLATVAHIILFGERPPKKNGVSQWECRTDDKLSKTLSPWFEKGLHLEPATRFSNAREMLEAFNSSQQDVHSKIVDHKIFEAFRAQTKEKDYAELDVLVDGDDCSVFKSEKDGRPCLVKVWHGVEPDERRPDKSVALLSFLERARAIKGCGLSSVSPVIDFGLSRRSLLLVSQWIDGDDLERWQSFAPSLPRRLSASVRLVEALSMLHSLEIAHGDIHPGNIVVGPDDRTYFVDILHFRVGADAYTTAYLPPNYKALSPFERDRYGLALVLLELLGAKREKPEVGEFPIPRVYEELARLLSEARPLSIDPLLSALRGSVSSTEEPEETFDIALPRSAVSGVALGSLLSDNGAFHVSAQKDRRNPSAARFWITGVGWQLTYSWDIPNEKLEYVRLAPIPQSQLLRQQTMRDFSLRANVELLDSPVADLGRLPFFLLDQKEFKRKFAHAPPIDAKSDAAQAATSRSSSNVPVREVWSTLLEAEEESFTTVVVAGEWRKNPSVGDQILVPYHLDVGVLDYAVPDKVLVQNQFADGTWRNSGTLNLKDTTVGNNAELAIDRPHERIPLSIGDKLRLISTQEKGSFTRRRHAVTRVVEGKAVVPNLIDYFEWHGDQPPSISFPPPKSEDIDAYNRGKIVLTSDQRDAFSKVLSNGPISLLQGPPGTGKTSFIAALLHYLISKERARRILLVSQSHEAVNTALEKAQDLCRELGAPFDAVRIGVDSSVSEPISHLHSTAIEASYREAFKAEHKERLVEIGASLGLPRSFSAEFADLHLRLGSLNERIARLQKEVVSANSRSDTLGPRLRSLENTFFDIAESVYANGERTACAEVLRAIETSLIAKYEIQAVDAVEQLRGVMRLSDDWLNALGSPDANFAEFLAKSRTIVAGTCVGIGYRNVGVVQNIYDWVIIDEAARAAPSELAVAMQAGRRVLLVGDHQQLPPTFSEDVKKSISRRFGSEAESKILASDFERLFESDYGKKVGSTLLTQYRMAPSIGHVVSECFYEGRLLTGRDVPSEYYDCLPPTLDKEVIWIDTECLGDRAREQTDREEVERWNEGEARVIMDVVRSIVESAVFLGFLQEDLSPQEPAIGIICAYGKQRSLLDQMKAEATWLGSAKRLVKIDTVDSYQGKENRIVILSTVRNNPKMNPGFLVSPNRVNVAMSRAMDRLIVVGSTRMWRGKNEKLPLGRALHQIELLKNAGKASVIDASAFAR